MFRFIFKNIFKEKLSYTPATVGNFYLLVATIFTGLFYHETIPYAGANTLIGGRTYYFALATNGKEKVLYLFLALAVIGFLLTLSNSVLQTKFLYHVASASVGYVLMYILFVFAIFKVIPTFFIFFSGPLLYLSFFTNGFASNILVGIISILVLTIASFSLSGLWADLMMGLASRVESFLFKKSK